MLVTGHTGFKGSWLALWLQRSGADLFGISFPAARPSLFALADVGRGMTSREGDVRDVALLDAAISEHRPEVVIHLAAQALVRRSYEQPLETYSANVLGTAAVLEAVRRAGCVRAAVIVTSDKCYQNDGRSTTYSERDRLGGADPYSSKAAAELVTAAYRTSFFLAASDGPAIATVRAGNVIGGGDWAADRLVPDVMRALIGGMAPIIRSPTAVRPWQHVLDCLNGYLCLAERMILSGREFEGAWNFGPDPGQSCTVDHLVDQLCAGWGPATRWSRETRPQPPEAQYLQLDSAKARERLSWRPHLQLADALRSTVAWYKAYARGEDLRKVTLDQIDGFEQRQ